MSVYLENPKNEKTNINFANQNNGSMDFKIEFLARPEGGGCIV
jgi:hypothetical protein